MVGKTGAARRSHAWQRVYRSLNHGQARQICSNEETLNQFPEAIESFGDLFVAMQDRRHLADYAPNESFTKSSIIAEINEAENVIERFNAVDVQNRRAFVACVLFKNRPDNHNRSHNRNRPHSR